jgi:ABC-type phosphate/phosphonate transport system permease subunit
VRGISAVCDFDTCQRVAANLAHSEKMTMQIFCVSIFIEFVVFAHVETSEVKFFLLGQNWALFIFGFRLCCAPPDTIFMDEHILFP